MVRKAAWYRPADCVGFYPPSPRGELAKEIGKVLMEEGRRINFNLRAIETGGLSIAKQLVRPDLKGGEPCGRPGCVLDLCSGGVGHTTFPRLCIREYASSVEKWRRLPNIGENLLFVARIG